MAALHDRRARLLASLYGKFGEAADWTPAAGGAAIPVIIRRRGQDVDVGFGQSAALVWKDFLKVRASDVAQPAKGDLVAVAGETFRIIADPRRVRAGTEWICEPAPVRAL